MITQFTLSPELQQFLSGIESKAFTNVVWDITFEGTAPTLPSNPATIRRSLLFSRLSFTEEATPVEEYNCFIQNLDGSFETSVSTPRGL